MSKTFEHLKEHDIKQTDLNIFYQMGAAFDYLSGGNLQTGQDVTDLFLNLTFPRMWLYHFMKQTEDVGRYLKDSRDAAQEFQQRIEEIYNPARMQAKNAVTEQECKGLFSAKEKFEQCFEREAKSLMVFTVTPKGTYDAHVLIENPQEDFPPRLVAELPARFIADLKEAARCLVFDIPVGCAFHVCRATESLMLAYYEKLAKQKWPLTNSRDWNTYIQHLDKHKAPANITARLHEIRKMDRNPTIHPEHDVSLEEAQVLYRLGSGVNYYMADEMSRL